MGCKKCDEDPTLARGVGDTLARVIHNYTGIKPCSGCKDRQETLNRWLPYKKKPRKGKLKLRIRDRIRVSLIRWVRNIALKTLIFMERKLVRSTIAIQNRNIRKANSGKGQKMDPKSHRLYREAWHRGRLYGEKVWRARLSRRFKEIQSRKNIQENVKERQEIGG